MVCKVVRLVCLSIAAVSFVLAGNLSQTSADSILQPPSEADNLYAAAPESLSGRDRWRIRLHGLRNAPLNPSIWAFRRIDRTDNRRLIPIRPYYLRASENPGFRLSEVATKLRFDPVTDNQMTGAPSIHTPIFEIGFSGSFVMGLPGERPREDLGYAVRISLSPLFPSGFIYRSHANSVLHVPIDAEFVSGQSYQIALRVSRTSAKLFVDEKLVGEMEAEKGRDLRQGLVNVNGNWHPLTLRDLRVSGLTTESGKDEPINLAGLVSLDS